MIELVAPLRFSLEALSTLFARSFEGYFLPFPDDPVRLDYLLRCEGVSLVHSRVALDGGAPVGVALLARRGATERVAAMGICASHRGRGIGRMLLARLQEEAAARGVERMILEVIDVNEPALRLYERLGFARVRRLRGYEGSIEGVAAPLEPCPIESVAALLPPDLPWQAAPATIANLALPNTAYRLGGARAVVAVDGEVVRLRALAVEPGARGTGAAGRLLRALAAAHPGRAWQVGAFVPEGAIERTLLGAGLRHGRFSQWEMEWWR